jgi:2-C-methyl-D-erythritol 2,4-cyclodiphosphate synthase
MTETNLRIGHGYDVHRFARQFSSAKPLRLAGCELPDRYSLEAHSDGDLVLHALCDALLGAAALGDIGEHFPDTDARYKGINSRELVTEVLVLLQSHGLALVNVDITVIAQVPRLAPYRPQMRDSIALLLELPAERVNLKATTTERLGYIGREEGIACHCVVLLVKAVAP